MTTKSILIALYWYLTLVLSKPQDQETWTNFWGNTQPGDLLKSLDQITSSTKILPQPLTAEANIANNEHLHKQQTLDNALQRRADEGSEEVSNNEEPYNYDNAYEEFVRKYFDDALTDAASASASKESEEYEAEHYSGENRDSSEGEEPIIEASTKTKKKEKCKKVIRGKENCLICKDPLNGMTSESCSYNKELKPQNFAFEKQQNFRKYRVKPKESSEVPSTKDISAAHSFVSEQKSALQTPNRTNGSTICMINSSKNKTCYYCGNKKGKFVVKCYAEETPEYSTSNKQKKDEIMAPMQNTRQRIYKRTISYSYENTPHAHTTNNGTEVLQKPLVHKHFLFKELNENER